MFNKHRTSANNKQSRTWDLCDRLSNTTKKRVYIFILPWFANVVVSQLGSSSVTHVRNLGVVFDSEMLMTNHVNSVTRTCFYQLRFVRRSLSRESAELLVHAFISSRVDYCNSLLYGASGHVIRKLQAILNTAARLITGAQRFDHITPALRDDLHWLPVRQRVQYKIALLVYKCLHGKCPPYLQEYCTALSANDLHHSLRSTARGDICRPRTATRRLGTRSFASSAPAIWNSLPLAVRNCVTVTSFKLKLKQHCFNIAYVMWCWTA